MSTIGAQSFSGVSSYSSDFQSILTRAVNIASLPLKQLQNTESDILQKKSQLGSFGDSVSTLAASFKSFTKAVTTGAIQAASSDSAVVTANASGADSAATYTINTVTSLASTASETSTAGFTDSATTSVSASGALRLVVGSQTYNVNLSTAHNNLLGLRNAINSLGAGVTASILTTGSGPGANYLSLSANTNGHTTLQLFEDPSGANTNILTAANQGSDAVFQLNGIPVTRQSNIVNDVVPGVSFTLKARSTTPATITLSASRAALSTALSEFVSSYNGVVDQVSGQVGKAAGLLSGNSIISQTASTLRQIVSYSGGTGSSIQSLAELGVTLDAHGKASFDATNLNGFSDTQLASAFSFVGNSSRGFAALGAKLEQLSDPVTGLIRVQQDSFDRSDSSLKTRISDLQDRITVMQSATQSRLQKMDALLASLEAQQKVITASVQSVNLTLFGKNSS